MKINPALPSRSPFFFGGEGPRLGKEVCRVKIKLVFAGMFHEHLRTFRRNKSTSAAPAFRIGPSTHTHLAAPRDLRHGLYAARLFDDGACRFHGAKIAIFAIFVKPLYCDFVVFRNFAINATLDPCP